MLLSNIYIFAMSRSHRTIFTGLCTIALLLWGQSAVVQHELDHSWHDESELCQVFISADNAKAAFSCPAILANNAVVEKGKKLCAPIGINFRPSSETARGPPLTA